MTSYFPKPRTAAVLHPALMPPVRGELLTSLDNGQVTVRKHRAKTLQAQRERTGKAGCA